MPARNALQLVVVVNSGVTEASPLQNVYFRFQISRVMRRENRSFWIGSLILICIAGTGVARGQRGREETSEFGPVVRAYLGYLKNEQEVVDDRASRHEINRAYYIRNSNRIRALRQIAIRIARETENDYLPELEAATRDELAVLFEHPPKIANLQVGEVYSNTFRFLGAVRSGDIYYVFARLDPYEQADLMEREKIKSPEEAQPSTQKPVSGEVTGRPRRAGAP
jgi:hypothetical protein